MFSALLAVLFTIGLFGLLGSVITRGGSPTLLDRNTRSLRAGQTGDRLIGVMLVIVIAVSIGFIGTDVLDTLEDSVTSTDLSSTNAENQTQFENASEEISTGFTDSMGLADVVFIVLMFSVILGSLLAFRMR